MHQHSTKKSISPRLIADLFLFLAALIWGFGFVSQRIGAIHLGFFGFNGVRFLLGGIALLPFLVRKFSQVRQSWKWVVLAGSVLFGGSTLQQAGLETTTAGAAGFITGVYVVLVPILMSLFWQKPSSWVTWLSAAIALLGTYLLSTGGRRLDPSTGDLLVLMGAVMWALHVIVVGFAMQKMDAFAFSAGQFLVCSAIHLVMSTFTEPLTISAILSTWLAMLYAGLCSAALGFTFQAIGQRKSSPTDAALILSLEAVFAAVAGVLFLKESMNWIQGVGCLLIMGAILFAQTYSNKKQEPVPLLSPLE